MNPSIIHVGVVYEAKIAKELQRSKRGVALTDVDKVKEARGHNDAQSGGLGKTRPVA